MMRAVLVLVAFAAVALAAPSIFEKPAAGGSNFAVIVAGSSSWMNYRHQADACHAYQILHAHGIPDENIIVMMYDDIAHNRENPTPGVIINRPDGPNVYENIKLDYTGRDVTPTNFLKVLKGDAEGLRGVGTGRVLNSGPNDNVFINFVDHGGPQIIAFPAAILHASALNEALKDMHTNQKYSQLVFYMEACESGSMFENLLPTDINVFATTASDPDSSSYACYYNQTLHTYLGDVYSVNWMENTDAGDVKTETLQQQYEVVKKETNTSTVCQYGTTSFSSDPIGNFLGSGSAYDPVHVPITEVVDSRDVQAAILRHRIADAKTDEERTRFVSELDELLARNDRVMDTFARIARYADSVENVNKHFYFRGNSREFQCVESTIDAVHEKCFSLSNNDMALKLSSVLVSLCDNGIPAETVVAAVNKVCPKPLF
eukprot:m.287169 g.287169  ORF g.287169 m.287169 type:complete len:431 (-) comp11724_c0_seq1:146-1438(-)